MKMQSQVPSNKLGYNLTHLDKLLLVVTEIYHINKAKTSNQKKHYVIRLDNVK